MRKRSALFLALIAALALTEQDLACVRSGGEAHACVQQVDP